jgi:hypothetical protein
MLWKTETTAHTTEQDIPQPETKEDMNIPDKESPVQVMNLVGLLQQKEMLKERIELSMDPKEREDLTMAFACVEQDIEIFHNNILKVYTPKQANPPSTADKACSSGSRDPLKSVPLSPITTPRATSAAATPPKSPDKKKARTDASDDEFDENPLGIDMSLE